jgi:hypothetical protein
MHCNLASPGIQQAGAFLEDFVQKCSGEPANLVDTFDFF